MFRYIGLGEECFKQEGHDGPVSVQLIKSKNTTSQTLQYLTNWFQTRGHAIFFSI